MYVWSGCPQMTLCWTSMLPFAGSHHIDPAVGNTRTCHASNHAPDYTQPAGSTNLCTHYGWDIFGVQSYLLCHFSIADTEFLFLDWVNVSLFQSVDVEGDPQSGPWTNISGCRS